MFLLSFNIETQILATIKHMNLMVMLRELVNLKKNNNHKIFLCFLLSLFVLCVCAFLY